jgi:hypothetical protein
MQMIHYHRGNVDDGLCVGQSINDPIAFHGAVPSVQRSGAAQAAVVTTAPALTSYGFTSAQATAIITLVNEMRAVLVAKGLMAGA